MPKTYVYDKDAWWPRKRGAYPIGRIFWVHLGSNPERFYLRVLLTREESRGCASFAELRKVCPIRTTEAVQYETFPEACAAPGCCRTTRSGTPRWRPLQSQMSRSLRSLFCNILIHRRPSDVKGLFETLGEDLSRVADASEEHVRFGVLLLLKDLALQQNAKQHHPGRLPELAVTCQRLT